MWPIVSNPRWTSPQLLFFIWHSILWSSKKTSSPNRTLFCFVPNKKKYQPYRSSHRRCSVKKGALKNFAIFTEKHLCWNLFLIKLQDWRPTTLLKRDSNTGVYLLNISEFLRAPILKNICETAASDPQNGNPEFEALFDILQNFIIIKRCDNHNILIG